MNRKLSREEAVKMMYSMDINKDFSEESFKKYLEDFELNSIDYDYIEKVIIKSTENLNKIDDLINKNSRDWKINRIAKVDLAILRVAITEILYEESIPSSVSINEAVEISKKYSSEDSHKFVNGILGSIYRGLNE